MTDQSSTFQLPLSRPPPKRAEKPVRIVDLVEKYKKGGVSIALKIAVLVVIAITLGWILYNSRNKLRNNGIPTLICDSILSCVFFSALLVSSAGTPIALRGVPKPLFSCIEIGLVLVAFVLLLNPGINSNTPNHLAWVLAAIAGMKGYNVVTSLADGNEKTMLIHEGSACVLLLFYFFYTKTH